MRAIWILISCNTKDEAVKIGDETIQKRLAGCYDIFERELAKYYWPPKDNKFEESKGCLLTITTFENKYKKIVNEIKKLHSDKTPFIGFVQLNGLTEDYQEWMKGEIK